jgi:formate-dependent nitrite reductase membrane component NrfD
MLMIPILNVAVAGAVVLASGASAAGEGAGLAAAVLVCANATTESTNTANEKRTHLLVMGFPLNSLRTFRELV